MSRARNASRKAAPCLEGNVQGPLGPDDLLELWFALAREEWSTLVIAPAHPGGSADEIARALAEAGKSLSAHPVTAVTLKALGPGAVRALIAVTQHVRGDEALPAWRTEMPPEMQKLLVADFEAEEKKALPREEARKRDRMVGEEFSQGMPPPICQLIIAIPSVLTDPLGVAVARAADGVLLAVEMGQTRLQDTARSVELIGREHIFGTCLIKYGGGAGGPRR